MCQIVSGHRSDVENLPTSRRLIRNSYPMDSAIKLPCAGLNKVPLPPDEPGIKATGSSPHLSSQCPINAIDHSCFICSRFLENGLSNLTISPPNSDTTPLSVFKVLRRSTQPAHLLVFSAVIVLAILFYPSRKANLPKLEIQSVESTLWPLLYLSSFSILFGAQMWMTFVSGLVLLFVLPRHTFACVQSALFPKYMILNGITALAVLISFVETKKVWSSQENYQVIGLIINCLCPLLARVVVVPTLLERIKAKVILERAAGHGPEAGPKLTSCTEAALKKCSTYRQTCRRFRQLHAVVAIVNIVTLACNAFHLYYLASKIAFHH